MNETQATVEEVFGCPVHTYTRAQAIDDGVLVDLTEWGSADMGFRGGFTVGVAVTAAVWAEINSIPPSKQGFQDVRGRAHDVLYMGSRAVRHPRTYPHALFRVIMHVGRKTYQTYKIGCEPGDDGEPVVTIMKPDED